MGDKMKIIEYSICFKNGDEEHSESIREIKSICKEYKKKEKKCNM